MINGKTVLAVIPARSGSKRCPGKNFLPFRGRPLYLWSIEQAAAAKCIDKTVLSLDANRPPTLCNDTATNEDVLRHHLKQHPHDIVILLQPTSPLRTAKDISACLALHIQEGKPVVSYSTTVIKHGGKNGAVYVASAAWIADHDFSDPDHVRYVMPDERSLDIDFPEEFFSETDEPLGDPAELFARA